MTNPTAGCFCTSCTDNSAMNLPDLSQIAFRAGDFNSFRSALLTPLLSATGENTVEQALTDWSSGIGISEGADPSVADMAVMMAEWWAYLGDILTLYNERIANEDYLRTAIQPESAPGLVGLLGYRPRPAIAATGMLAALVTGSVKPGHPVTLPAGLQFQSKPGPGQAPQTFELSAETAIGVPDVVPAAPATTLVEPATGGGTLLLQGAVTSVSNGTPLLLGTRDDTTAASLIVLNAAPSTTKIAGGGKQTQLAFSGSVPTLSAANARLSRANQNMALWTVTTGTFDNSTQVHLAGLARQIRAGDFVVFSAPGVAGSPQLIQIASTMDVVGDASSSGTAISVSDGVAPHAKPIPVLHTRLVLKTAVAAAIENAAASVTVLFDWIEVGVLIDQPPAAWYGSAALVAAAPAAFAAVGSATVLIADSNGNGTGGTGILNTDGSLSMSWPSSVMTPLVPGMTAPIEVYSNLLPVSCGKTVANEVMGSGDATVAGQSFTLAKAPVTYLAAGSSYASTIALTVNGFPWTEVASFYGQAANAQVFVTREDSGQQTHIDFGDGVNGMRLPTGVNNVVANYRVGGGADSPAAGKLTVIAQSYPGLKAVVNPVAVSGGSDPDPASLLKEYAPRSVLTFGRAVSIFDYEAIAAQAPGVSLAAAKWSWDAASQHAGVTVYVAGEANVATSVATALAAAGDQNRPVSVVPATAVNAGLTMSLIVTPGMDNGAIQAGVTSALCDSENGLFCPANLGIGQVVFDSQIEAACLGVSGVVAIKSSSFTANGAADAGPLHLPGEGCYYLLAASDVQLTTEADANG